MRFRSLMLASILLLSACDRSAPPSSPPTPPVANQNLAHFTLKILGPRQTPPRLVRTEEMPVPLVEAREGAVGVLHDFRPIWRIECTVSYIPGMPSAPSSSPSNNDLIDLLAFPKGPWPYEVARTDDTDDFHYHLLKGGMSFADLDGHNDAEALRSALEALKPELGHRALLWRAGAKKVVEDRTAEP